VIVKERLFGLPPGNDLDMAQGGEREGSLRSEPFANLHLALAPSVAGPLPGPKSRALLKRQAEIDSRARIYPRGLPIALEEGRGATVRDADGNVLIDFFAGAGVLNVGHGNPYVLAAATDQMARLVHALDFPTEARLRLMQTLKPLLPGDLAHTARFHFGGPTGSDAIEAAIKLARTHTGRTGIVAFQGSYHGMTAGALAATASSKRRSAVESTVDFLPFPYAYRSPLGLPEEDCWRACVRMLETCLTDPLSGIAKPAAVLVEPIQGEGGTIVPPPGFLPGLRQLTREHGVLLIVDEIQTGFGRTGRMFACEHEGVSPDIVALSKALGGIGLPLSCIAYDEKLDSWEPGAHLGTFRGHQVAMAAGAAALEYMAEFDLVRHAGELGDHALDYLRAETSELTAVGEVRGRGLFIGVELVRDRETREPWPELAHALRRTSAERGLIFEIGGHFNNVVRFLPPLVITRSLLEQGLQIFLASLRDCETSSAVEHRVGSARR
jgi:diaminobutyrate-2-oxoglutarate transaminase